ncbi:DEAD/DEAH box helicase [Lactococcus termiticola]|uniref:DEAD-box ATP-dependent RNA helicase CshB n=1 Tax=Lactococcus termiticola TaxID=2169526 RepID=A0A2R5HGJ7_9LACT|nr:DEAD/DEAH box helicase [Lactococcus termiticola]GBG96465.1 DEAD/DEAH box helicase [Lactococcus termiticola]
MKFTDFNFNDNINQALGSIKFIQPTEVQEKLIPIILKGRDLVGESKTGSGKTHTFLLPIFQKLNPELDEVQAVIAAPSRELATQIYEAAKVFVKFDERIKVSNFVGGTDKVRQIRKLEAGQPHIVIGTPGRLWDLMSEGSLKAYTAKTFVVDEADMTLDMGFLAEVDKIAASFGDKVQMLVFSATIPQKLQPFLKKYLSNPVMEKIANKTVISDTIENWLLSNKGASNNQLILQLTQIINPYMAMIFANTKGRVDEIHAFLTNNGVKAAKIHGDIPPRERKRTMNAIKNLDYQYVIATDIAARGIDIEGVSHIINDEIPQDLTFFVHRVGRSGRNGLKGTAITIYAPSDDASIREIEKMGVKFEPKAIRNGEIIDSYDRDRREKRTKAPAEISNLTRGAIAKGKKKVKPGYKRAIKWQIEEENKKKRRAERNKNARKQRESRKQSF